MSIAKNPRKYSLKFWIIFWVAAAVLLFGWYVFSEVSSRNFQDLKPFAGVLPVGDERQRELEFLADLYGASGPGAGEKNFLILFQNDMELRPGGGFIGSFGVLKVENGRMASLDIRDTGVFDAGIPNEVAPPDPIAETFHTAGWKLRDSNWSPDFAVNAGKAEYLYHLGGGKEDIDGVIAVNTDVLNSILSVTGPVKIDDYPGEYNDETAVLQLEYQVEKGYREQGIEKEERKSVMRAMAETLMAKVRGLGPSQYLELAEKIEKHLKEKDIQMFFKDGKLQSEAENLGWAGRVRDFSGDYFALVDANLNSLKSDICLRRSVEYTADFTGDVPRAELAITYEHTCRAKDWLTTNYNDWARVYAPAGAYLTEASGLASLELERSGQEDGVEFSEDLGKKVFGFYVYVPIGETKTVTLKYNLPASAEASAGKPDSISDNDYKLLIQKQSGSGELPTKITVRKKDGSTVEKEEILTGDTEISL